MGIFLDLDSLYYVYTSFTDAWMLDIKLYFSTVKRPGELNLIFISSYNLILSFSFRYIHNRKYKMCGKLKCTLKHSVIAEGINITRKDNKYFAQVPKLSKAPSNNIAVQ